MKLSLSRAVSQATAAHRWETDLNRDQIDFKAVRLDAGWPALSLTRLTPSNRIALRMVAC
jgi:hypothetical protein